MRRFLLILAACLPALPAVAQTIPGGNCSAATLNGPYSLNLEGRDIGGQLSAGLEKGHLTAAGGAFTALYAADGTATFDGTSGVSFAGAYDSSQSSGQFSFSGTYTIASNCLGTVTLTTGSSATFTLTAYSGGRQFDLTGSDATYMYYGGGNNYLPPACANATLSGLYGYQVTGGAADGAELSTSTELGIFQFDGNGGVKGGYVFNSVEGNGSFSGTYTVTPSCQATVTITDTTSNQISTFKVSIAGTYGEGAAVIESGGGKTRSGQTRSVFATPTQSITNAASYAANGTPAGSVFALFGLNLGTGGAQPSMVPLPTAWQNTSVTVNNERAPLFFVGTNQINAQMPWDIPGNTLATVTVSSAGGTSNTAAVYVPAAATPGVSFSLPNRAAVVNADGTTNSATNPAAVGDEVVVYFTGGGPVNPSGTLVTGAGAPAGLSPVTDLNATVTVGGVVVQPIYVGLTPTGVGLYQSNFNVPQLAAGTYPVVITISGDASNSLGGPVPSPVMTVSN